MSPLQHFVRASGDARLIAAVAAKLRAEWDPSAEFTAPDSTQRPESHAATILGMFSTGGDTANVRGYLRRAETAALETPRTTGGQRSQLVSGIFQMMIDAGIAASLAERGSND